MKDENVTQPEVVLPSETPVHFQGEECEYNQCEVCHDPTDFEPEEIEETLDAAPLASSDEASEEGVRLKL